MYGKHRRRSHVGDIELPVFSEEGDYYSPSGPTGLVVAGPTAGLTASAQMAIQPVTGVQASAGAPVSYTGTSAGDAGIEAASDVPEAGNKMLTWLVVGGIALFVLFGKNMLKAR